MGFVYENIALENATDVMNVMRGIIHESQIRKTETTAMVDTGAETLVINEAMRQELGLEVIGEKTISLANEAIETCKVTEPVKIYWKNRFTFTEALILPGADEILLGAIALEGLNVIVDPLKQRLVGRHGDEVIFKIK